MDIAKISKQLEGTGYIVLAKPLVAELLADLFTCCHDDDSTRLHPAHGGQRCTTKSLLSELKSKAYSPLHIAPLIRTPDNVGRKVQTPHK
jgi:CelD/BcsL family acetyltransferase involved in cellulose biosynthesis